MDAAVGSCSEAQFTALRGFLSDVRLATHICEEYVCGDDVRSSCLVAYLVSC